MDVVVPGWELEFFHAEVVAEVFFEVWAWGGEFGFGAFFAFGSLEGFRAWVFLFLEGAAEFFEGDVLELADSFAGDAEFLTDLFECFGLMAVEAEAGVDDFSFAFVEHVEQPVELVVHVAVAEDFVRRLGAVVADDFAEFGGIVVGDGCGERLGGDWRP
jgi:hypothetical protein